MTEPSMAEYYTRPDPRDYDDEAFPCNRGTDEPVGWHKFYTSNGIVICEYCGERASTW